MIKELNNIAELEAVSGGLVIRRSGSFTSGTSSTGPGRRSSAGESAFARFEARRERARARNARFEAEREASGSTGGGFPPSAALGLP